MPDLELVGRGRTAEVYALDTDRVVKLLLPGINPLVLEREAEFTAAAHGAGAPAPAVFGAVELEGRAGWVFERVAGDSLAALLPKRPWKSRTYARLAAEVQFRLHQRHSTDLPLLSDRLAAKIDHADVLNRDLRRRAKDALVGLDGSESSVLHGDFHADNVLLAADGPTVIDWLDASRGDPAADVARSQWLSSPAVLPPDVPLRSVVAGVLARFGREYFRHYLRISAVTEEVVRAWQLPVLAGRLSEGIEHEEEALVTTLRRRAGF
jgi:aminoglycoside phosphotransferase (APT) family kinase protein